MKTTTVPADRLSGLRPPARTIVPRPLWQRDQLFQEPQYPEALGLEDEDEGDDEG